MATPSSGHISQVVGSFFNVNVSSEDQNNNPNDPNDFSIQLNTNSDFKPSMCGTKQGCTGWEQFVYWGGSSEVWYILLGYGTPCPSSSWGQQTGSSDCYLMGSNTYAVPQPQKITNLGNMTVTGVAGTTNDSTIVTTGDGVLYKVTNPSYLNLINYWTLAEFNVFGDNTYANATFGANSTLSVKLSLTNGTQASPTCILGDETGETNNLTLVPSACCAYGGTNPAITFTESNVSPLPEPSFCLLNDITPIQFGLQ
jgi:hypothetical protein